MATGVYVPPPTTSSENPWWKIQTILPKWEHWPKMIVEKFWVSDLEYQDRVFIAAFAYLNRVPCDILIDALEYCNKNACYRKLRHVEDWYAFWTGENEEAYRRRSLTYSYSFMEKCFVDLNGNCKNKNVSYEEYLNKRR